MDCEACSRNKKQPPHYHHFRLSDPQCTAHGTCHAADSNAKKRKMIRRLRFPANCERSVICLSNLSFPCYPAKKRSLLHPRRVRPARRNHSKTPTFATGASKHWAKCASETTREREGNGDCEESWKESGRRRRLRRRCKADIERGTCWKVGDRDISKSIALLVASSAAIITGCDCRRNG